MRHAGGGGGGGGARGRGGGDLLKLSFNLSQYKSDGGGGDTTGLSDFNDNGLDETDDDDDNQSGMTDGTFGGGGLKLRITQKQLMEGDDINRKKGKRDRDDGGSGGGRRGGGEFGMDSFGMDGNEGDYDNGEAFGGYRAQKKKRSLRKSGSVEVQLNSALSSAFVRLYDLATHWDFRTPPTNR